MRDPCREGRGERETPIEKRERSPLDRPEGARRVRTFVSGVGSSRVLKNGLQRLGSRCTNKTLRKLQTPLPSPPLPVTEHFGLRSAPTGQVVGDPRPGTRVKSGRPTRRLPSLPFPLLGGGPLPSGVRFPHRKVHT